MLKSYKQLSRWYGALEPEKGTPETAHPGEASSAASAEDDGPARYPDYIREDDEPWGRPAEDIPSNLPAQRSEFTGGWSDWVAGRAPSPYDDYTPPRQAGLARFPRSDGDNRVDRPRASGALRQAAREHPAVRRARTLIVLIAAALLLGAAIACVLFLLHASGNRAAAPKDSPVPASVQFTVAGAKTGVNPRAVSGGACPTERGDSIVRSAEAGGTDSGPDAVLSFQYAYYVERSGERAREAVAPDAAVQPASVIQRGIDTIPAGTTHCVRIVTIADNRYSVEVTEYRPGGGPATYNKQTVTTAVTGGRTLITGIAAG
ncbi:hypothetical protein OHB12_12740 [Nocardia sp. NBC_01730]|uniref:hypothetical protein n=1 Tax=Nocardia sp. NBC_01730 TaxID=2975998 RepID=UPI002E1053EB|nr:hypothetical protein OHB12_12740 [Nocardia sp. NBC_01730]